MIDDDYLLMYLSDFLSATSCCRLITTNKRFQTPLITEYLQKRMNDQYKIIINGVKYRPTTLQSNWSLECELPNMVPCDELEQLQIITPHWNFDAYIDNTSDILDFENDREHYVVTFKEQKIYIWLDTNGKYEIKRVRFSYSPPVYKNLNMTKYLIYAALSYHYYSFWSKFEMEGHICMLWMFCVIEAFFFMKSKQEKLYRAINAARRD